MVLVCLSVQQTECQSNIPGIVMYFCFQKWENPIEFGYNRRIDTPIAIKYSVCALSSTK